eukprot:11195154-Alexandrium_andersonii.AAC.1
MELRSTASGNSGKYDTCVFSERRPSYAGWSCGALHRDIREDMIHACSLKRRPSYARWSCGAP